MIEGYAYAGKRYVALVRASNADEGTTSTQAQLSMLHDQAARLKMIHVADVVLDGVSGSMPGKRKDMAALLARKAADNDFDVLVVQRLDRLTRSGSDHGFWFEHECKRAGIHLLVVGDDIPEGRYSSLIKVAKYEAAREQAFSISQRSTQGYQLALEEGRVTTSSHTPFACWRLYLSADNKPLHIIRDLGDGRQQKLDPQTHAVIDTYGQIGGGSKGHYRKARHEKVLLMPGDVDEIAIIRTIFDLHFRQGWGGKRIADHLNRQGVASPAGKQWSQRQVEVLYNNEVYTGRSVGNRTSSGIFHQRNHAAPKPTKLDPAVHATAETMPVRLRPKDEWFVVEQPLLKDLLADEPLRMLAIEGQDRFWQHLADPNRAKRSNSKYKTSDYLLTGLLFAKQDNGPLVGVLCGRVGKKVRYYRHRRGRTGYRKGSVFNKMIQADKLEQAVLDAVRATLLDEAFLKERLTAIIAAESQARVAVDVDDLRRQRDKLKKRTELIIANLDEDSLADGMRELDKLKAERRRLDEQIAAAASIAAPARSPADILERCLAKTKIFLADRSTLPNHLLRDWLAAAVSTVVVDMKTKAIEIELIMPSASLKSGIPAEKAMRLVSSLASSIDYETHRSASSSLTAINCWPEQAPAGACYRCRRIVA